MIFGDLRSFLDQLRRDRELVEISAPVDPKLEAAEIHRRVIAAGGPALLFTNVKGADFPLVTNLFGTAGEHSPWMKFEEVVAADPDLILIAPCGFNMDRAALDLPLLTSRPEWAGLKAVRNGQVFLGEGNQYFNRPGPRIVESLEIMAEIFHPQLFSFGHEGPGWRRL